MSRCSICKQKLDQRIVRKGPGNLSVEISESYSLGNEIIMGKDDMTGEKSYKKNLMICRRCKP